MDHRRNNSNYKKQRGGNKTDVTNRLDNTYFVLNGKILGSVEKAMIISLIDEFYEFTRDKKIRHNFEISQQIDSKYISSLESPDDRINCDNCSIVVKYHDAVVCPTDARVDTSNTRSAKCDLGVGTIKLFLRRKHDDSFKDEKIRLVQVLKSNDLSKYIGSAYHDNKVMDEIAESTDKAMGTAQVKALKDISKTSNVNSKIVDDVIDKTKSAVVHGQTEMLGGGKGLSGTPDKESVEAANTVAKHLSGLDDIKKGTHVIVTVPTVDNIGMNKDNSVKQCPINIDRPSQNGSEIVKTLNEHPSDHRASVPVDATIAIAPVDSITNNPNLVPVESSNSAESALNKLASVSKDYAGKATGVLGTASDKTGQFFGDVFRKIQGWFTGGACMVDNRGRLAASVVSVSKNLNVLTPLEPETAKKAVPVPTESKVKHSSDYSEEDIRRNVARALGHQSGGRYAVDSERRTEYGTERRSEPRTEYDYDRRTDRKYNDRDRQSDYRHSSRNTARSKQRGGASRIEESEIRLSELFDEDERRVLGY